MIYSGGLRSRDCCEDVGDFVHIHVFGPIDDDDDDDDCSLTKETGIASRAASTAVNDVFDESKFKEKKSIKEKVKRAKEKISIKYIKEDDDDDSSLTEETEIASRAAFTAVNDVFDESKFEEKKSIKENMKAWCDVDVCYIVVNL